MLCSTYYFSTQGCRFSRLSFGGGALEEIPLDAAAAARALLLKKFAMRNYRRYTDQGLTIMRMIIAKLRDRYLWQRVCANVTRVVCVQVNYFFQ